LVASSDIEYKKTKLIKQGRKRIEEKFENLAKWISENYNVDVIDIQEEFMKHNSKVRIAVHLETHEDAMEFREGDDWWTNFDSVKQNEIAEKYIEIGNLFKVPANGFLGKVVKRNPKVTDIFVSFSAFEPIAREEVNGLIPENRIEKLHKEMKLPEIWTISRCFGSATLFVYEDEQKDRIKNSDGFKLIEDKYFELLKEYDEFNYWKRENFRIGIDSKQNFDDNYDSNWYYYYK
jgi:ribosome-associated translation inhibitor RaiA